MKGSYEREFTVDSSPQEAFTAITTKMNEWWSHTSDSFLKVGDKATVTFDGMETYWSFEAIELNKPNLIILECIDSHHVHIGQSNQILTEWLNTKLVFKIDKVNSKTRISFTHLGLTPVLKCFNVCEEGWDHFVGDSLRLYLSSGK